MLRATFDSSHFSCIQLPLSFHRVHLALMYHHSFTAACIASLGKAGAGGGGEEKKDSCGALYFEKVSSVSIEGTQPLSVSQG